jgi:hypothetical protein
LISAKKPLGHFLNAIAMLLHASASMGLTGVISAARTLSFFCSWCVVVV